MPRRPTTTSKSARAALLYMQGGVTMRDAADRYGVSPATVHSVLHRMRAAERGTWPEDEVTC